MKIWPGNTETAPYRLTVQINENVMDIYPALKKPTGHFLDSIPLYNIYIKVKAIKVYNR